MFAELLVVGMCLQNKGGCHESSEAYYKDSPKLQEMVKNGEKMAKKNIPRPIIEYVFPIVAAGVGQRGTIKLSNHWAIEIDKGSGGSLVLRWNY